MNDLTELRRVAEGGIEGPCKAVMSTYVTFDPPTVLALIDELERLRGVVEHVRDLAESYPPIASTRPVGTEAIRIYERYVVARKILAILGDHLGGGMK